MGAVITPYRVCNRCEDFNVGYAEVAQTNVTDKYLGVGSLFFPVGGGTSFNLLDCSMYVVDDDEDFMYPRSEYIRVIDASDAHDAATYTYISKEWMDSEFDNGSEGYEDFIGWYVYQSGYDYQEAIETDKDDSLKVKAAVNFPMGTSFLGYFGKKHKLAMKSSGEVKVATTSWEQALNTDKYGMIMNHLPTDIDISDITVDVVDDDEDFMYPRSEYLRFLSPVDASDVARYTYISREWMESEFDNGSEGYEDFIGWYVYQSGYDYQEAIETEKDDSLKIKSAFPIKAGQAFLGYMGKKHRIRFNFPDPTDIPSKK